MSCIVVTTLRIVVYSHDIFDFFPVQRFCLNLICVERQLNAIKYYSYVEMAPYAKCRR